LRGKATLYLFSGLKSKSTRIKNENIAYSFPSQPIKSNTYFKMEDITVFIVSPSYFSQTTDVRSIRGLFRNEEEAQELASKLAEDETDPFHDFEFAKEFQFSCRYHVQELLLGCESGIVYAVTAYFEDDELDGRLEHFVHRICGVEYSLQAAEDRIKLLHESHQDDPFLHHEFAASVGAELKYVVKTITLNKTTGVVVDVGSSEGLHYLLNNPVKRELLDAMIEDNRKKSSA
jgi:uncharacterized Fe-S cluster-containing protein